MATTGNGFDAQRFAVLWAGCDTGNENEAEALVKFRGAREIAKGNGLRVIDVIHRADVQQALDAQMQPVREESRELREAYEKVAQLADQIRNMKSGGFVVRMLDWFALALEHLGEVVSRFNDVLARIVETIRVAGGVLQQALGAVFIVAIGALIVWGVVALFGHYHGHPQQHVIVRHFSEQ